MTHANGKVLVTGAAGIVGRATLAALRATGLEAIAVTRAGPGLTVDLSHKGASGRLLAAVGEAPSAIIHLAAAVPHSARYPDDSASATLTRSIDRTVYQAQQQWGCALVYMSTCGLYNSYDPSVKTVDSALGDNLSPYFLAKLDGERRFEDHATILRLAAPVGLGVPAGLVIARFVANARADRDIEIWGSGRREQDFIDSRDVAALILSAISRGLTGTYNCARGQPVTMAALAHEVVRVIGRGRIRMAYREDPAEGQTARYDISTTRAAFGWRPTCSLADSLLTL